MLREGRYLGKGNIDGREARREVPRARKEDI
jgi:hypothetical protein